MKVAIEGCAHGELDKIYETLQELEKKNDIKIDLLLCCGDFQSVRNQADLHCMAVPPKFRHMQTFYKYYSGEKTAPVLTIFIGGNHEASNYLQELPFGGWVAPKIYYLGYAGIIKVGGLRIGGVSGIYKDFDYAKGHFECTPYSEDTKRSAYHVRVTDVFRLKQIKSSIDIFMSHDWPRGITNHGDHETLIQNKPFFREDIEKDCLGSPPCYELLKCLKPSYWFSAHLHCKFAAIVQHEDEEGENKKTTKFLALDKCLPNRKFLQVVEIGEPANEEPLKLEYDLEWLTVLRLTDHLTSVKKAPVIIPIRGFHDRWEFTPSQQEMEETSKKFNGVLKIPDNFVVTTKPYDGRPRNSMSSMENYALDKSIEKDLNDCRANPQTTEFCSKLGITDPWALAMETYSTLDSSVNETDSGNISIGGTKEESQVTPSRRSLALPAARFNDTPPSFIDDTDDSIAQPDSSTIDSPVLERTQADLVESSTPVEAKRFRRRNLEMYQNESP